MRKFVYVRNMVSYGFNHRPALKTEFTDDPAVIHLINEGRSWSIRAKRDCGFWNDLLHHGCQIRSLNRVSTAVENPMTEAGLGHELADLLGDVFDINATMPVVRREGKGNGPSQSRKRDEIAGPHSSSAFAPGSANDGNSQRDDLSSETRLVFLGQMLIQ